jgi:ATP-dependent protease ClpP protease subunit
MAKMTKMTVRKVTSKSTTKAPAAPTFAQGLAAAKKRKEAAQKLVGTNTPGGQPVKNISEALKIYDTMQATKRGVVSGRLKRN